MSGLEELLKACGYGVSIRETHKYRGHPEISKIVEVEKGGQLGFACAPPSEECYQLLRVYSRQTGLRMAAQITEVIGNKIFVFERATGMLLWEIVERTDLPPLADIDSALDDFVTRLAGLGLVHGDIRPWNIFYDQSQRQFKFIDWGFSYLKAIGPSMKTITHLLARGYERPFTRVDSEDARKTLSLFKGELSCEGAWRHQLNEKTWWPNWVKRD